MVSVFHLVGGTVQGMPTTVSLLEHGIGRRGFLGKGLGGKEEIKARKNQKGHDMALCPALFHLLRISHE